MTFTRRYDELHVFYHFPIRWDIKATHHESTFLKKDKKHILISIIFSFTNQDLKCTKDRKNKDVLC